MARYEDQKHVELNCTMLKDKYKHQIVEVLQIIETDFATVYIVEFDNGNKLPVFEEDLNYII